MYIATEPPCSGRSIVMIFIFDFFTCTILHFNTFIFDFFTCTILHFYTFYYSGEKCQRCFTQHTQVALGCEMPEVFHTTYSGRTLGVGEKCQVCFTQHTQVTGKAVNHIMKSKARWIWIMSVIYYYLHTQMPSGINIFCIHWHSISVLCSVIIL
jgi:hypothetical protein